ncbi:alpha/beta fold hydrolase [Streptomyces mangrovisoli]|uniref:alpha/beta fold hydrolase n=1 Tax=Streptomyces mangrovisoli TaxID=1428628 RepID=UPI0009A12B38
MPTFCAPDGTTLAYRAAGEGAPLVVLPGGPMRAARYLGDLGGLAAHRRLILLDLRGTGDSAAAADPASYRCDRLVGDVEALRAHLGLNRIDLLAHSAGGSLAMLYAARHPTRVARARASTASALGALPPRPLRRGPGPPTQGARGTARPAPTGPQPYTPHSAPARLRGARSRSSPRP